MKVVSEVCVDKREIVEGYTLIGPAKLIRGYNYFLSNKAVEDMLEEDSNNDVDMNMVRHDFETLGRFDYVEARESEFETALIKMYGTSQAVISERSISVVESRNPKELVNRADQNVDTSKSNLYDISAVEDDFFDVDDVLNSSSEVINNQASGDNYTVYSKSGISVTNAFGEIGKSRSKTQDNRRAIKTNALSEASYLHQISHVDQSSDIIELSFKVPMVDFYSIISQWQRLDPDFMDKLFLEVMLQLKKDGDPAADKVASKILERMKMYE